MVTPAVLSDVSNRIIVKIINNVTKLISPSIARESSPGHKICVQNQHGKPDIGRD